MRATIATKVGLQLLLLTAAAVVALAVFYRFLLETAPVMDAVAVAAHLHMQVRTLHPSADRPPAWDGNEQGRLLAAVKLIDQLTDVLEQGGQAVERTLPSPPPEARAPILEMKATWQRVKPELVMLSARPPTDPAAVQAHGRLHSDVPRLQRESDAVVKSLEASLLGHRQRMFRTLAWICGLDLALLLGGLWFTRRYIAGPIRRIEQGTRQVQGDQVATLAALATRLETERRHNQSIVEGVPVGLLVLSPEMRAMSSNRALEQIVGRKAVGQDLEAVLPAVGLVEKAREVLAGGSPQSNLFFGLPAGGEVRSLRVAIASIPDPEHASQRRLLLTVEDFTERQRLHNAAQLAEQRLHDLVQDLDAVVWEAEPAPFRFTFVSRRAEALLGYPVRRWLEQPDFWGLRLPDPDPAGTPQQLECPMTAADGRVVWFQNTFRAVHGGDVPVRQLRGVMLDITERKLAQEASLAAQDSLGARVRLRTAQLDASNRALEAFSYSVAHDLRAPLRAVEGFSAALQEELAAHRYGGAPHYIQQVRDSARQMGVLIDALLRLSLPDSQPLQRQTVSPAELARQVLAELGTNRQGRQIEVTIGSLPDCVADRPLLKQVFANLLDNALKFTSHREAAHIQIGCRPLNGDQVYFIKDNGAGFDVRYADRLFGAFQRLHHASQFEGTGVGLATVQRIIRRHGGRIWAEAEVDRGATFYFVLPDEEESVRAEILKTQT